LGAGVLALPYALKQAGLVWGGVLLLVSAMSTLYSLQLLVTACHVLHEYTYEGVVQTCLGTRARNITEISILFFCGGCAVAYVITVGDILGALHLPRQICMVLVWTTMMFPLSLLKTMTSLQAASGVGIFSIGLLVVVAIIHLVDDSKQEQDEHGLSLLLLPSFESLLWPANGMTSVLMACPLVLFAFSCQVNVCAIYEELDDKPNMTRVLIVAVTVCAVLYTAISLAAYLDFDTSVQPNVLQNYCPSSSPLIQMAFGGMTVAVVMAFPLNIFPTRVTLEGLYEKKQHRAAEALREVELASSVGTNDEVVEPFLLLLPRSNYYDEKEKVPFNWSCHFLITLAICGSVLALALVAPNISVVFGLLGGTTSSILGFILPGLVGMKVDPCHRGRAQLLVVIGVVVGILTTAVTVYSTLCSPPTTLQLDGVVSPQLDGIVNACNVSVATLRN
jgi:amino acid permease